MFPGHLSLELHPTADIMMLSLQHQLCISLDDVYEPSTDREGIALCPLFPSRGSETSPNFIKNCAKTSLLPCKSTIRLSAHHPGDKVSCRVFIPPSICVHKKTS